jgi:hypothetical protein
MKTRILPVILLLNLAICGSAMALAASDRLNVCSYGAIPNDTAADTTQIMAAINAVMPTPTPGPGYLPPPKSIYFPPGTYIFDGPMTLQANTSYRLYGDGPGVSTIIFTGSNPGITGTDINDKTLQIEGLTLQAGSDGCSSANVSALYAEFNKACDPGCGPILAKTATIRNVEIRGGPLRNTSTPTYYWANGITLKRAQNSVVEDVQVHGYFNQSTDGPSPNIGINYLSTNTFATTLAFLHNIYVKYYQTGISAQGYVESFRLSEFELFWCGHQNPTRASIEMNVYNGSSGYRGGVYHISDGHINQISSAIHMYTMNDVNISHVDFSNQEFIGTNIELHDCSQVTLANNDFHDQGYSQTMSNGIYVFATSAGSSSGIIMSGNSFRTMAQSPWGACIVLDSGCRSVKILDTLFDTSAAAHKYANSAPDTYIRDFP